jgi:ATP-dependent DNA ligase
MLAQIAWEKSQAINIYKKGGGVELNPAKGINLRNYDPNVILAGKLWRITEKVDGVRRLFYKNVKGEVTAYNKHGMRDPWLEHITDYLKLSNFPSEMVYDCELIDTELYLINEDSFLIRARTIGLASQQYADNKEKLSAICFDIFRPHGDTRIGMERDLILKEAFINVPLTAPIFYVTNYGILNGNDVSTLTHLMNNMILQNKEGLMLMDLNAPYIHGRSSSLIKVKRVEDFLGTVIDVEIADKGTKIEGGISALICEVSGCTVPVRVGSGFSNEERIFFVEHSPIGELIEIEAFGKTGKKGTISLSSPVFKRLLKGT